MDREIKFMKILHSNTINTGYEKLERGKIQKFANTIQWTLSKRFIVFNKVQISKFLKSCRLLQFHLAKPVFGFLVS